MLSNKTRVVCVRYQSVSGLLANEAPADTGKCACESSARPTPVVLNLADVPLPVEHDIQGLRLDGRGSCVYLRSIISTIGLHATCMRSGLLRNRVTCNPSFLQVFYYKGYRTKKVRHCQGQVPGRCSATPSGRQSPIIKHGAPPCWLRSQQRFVQ